MAELDGSRVLPTPPVPVSVTKLPTRNCSAISSSNPSPPMNTVLLRGRLVRYPSDAPWRWKVVLQIWMVYLEQGNSTKITESMCAQRANLDAIGQLAHDLADSLAEQDLATVGRRDDPRGVVNRHTDQVVAVSLHLAEVNPHANPHA